MLHQIEQTYYKATQENRKFFFVEEPLIGAYSGLVGRKNGSDDSGPFLNLYSFLSFLVLNAINIIMLITGLLQIFHFHGC